MIRSFCLVALFSFVCLPAAAQPTGVSGLWEHYFVEQRRTVYLDLRAEALVVWSVDDDGKCIQYPGGATWRGDSLRRTGQDWRVRLDAQALHVSFPDTTITYQPSTADPQSLCQREDI